MRASEFLTAYATAPQATREEAALQWLAPFASVGVRPVMAEVPCSFNGRAAHFYAAIDYFALGEGDDMVRMPLSAVAAQRAADMMGMRLPTARMVDLIWLAAPVRLEPIPMGPPYDTTMQSLRRIYEHDAKVNAVLAQVPGWEGKLLVGHKKDVVIDDALMNRPGMEAIYGWHRKDGSPVQPLSTVHAEMYADYSHGIRFIAATMVIDGEEVAVDDVLRDIKYLGMVSKVPMRLFRQPSVPVPNEPVTIPPASRATDYPFDQIPLMQAKWYTPGRKGSVNKIVIHDMEAPEGALTAENVGHYFQNPLDKNGQPVKASAHYGVDVDSVVQYVRDEDTAWHCPGANADGIGVEHAGYARQTAEEWADAYSIAMLERSAELVAALCAKHMIPIVRLTPEDVRLGRRGICGHDTCTDAFKTPNGHRDPGPNFPWQWYLERVRAHAG